MKIWRSGMLWKSPTVRHIGALVIILVDAVFFLYAYTAM